MALTNQMCWMVGGPQGSGVDSAARLFALATARGGLHVVGQREYYSNIKGEHSYYKLRVDEDPIRSPIDAVHLLASYENETVCRHLNARAVVAKGGIIYDPTKTEETVAEIVFLDQRVKDSIAEEFGKADDEVTVQEVLDKAKNEGVRLFPFPYDELLKTIAKELGMDEDDAARLQILKNTMATAASLGMLDYDLEVLNKTLEVIFEGKSERVIKMNKVASRVSADYMREQFGAFDWELNPVETDEERIFLQGTDAVGLGKLVAGCRMQTYYPISPATDESVFLEGQPKSGVTVVQVEDEIAAVTMAIGSAITGARSSTSTSGPGFNLMVEGMGWAGICEVPVVVVNYMRGGPSTGLPTRTEQGDARFALHAGHSEFPRFVLVPGDIQEMFFDTIDAFNWAERYQTLVILMPDKNLAGNSLTTTPFDTSGVTIDRGMLASEDDLTDGDTHQRFKFAEDGISLRSVLGQKGGIHWLTGDEHTEVGHITEDPEVRDRMMEKRAAKLELAAQEIPGERKAALHGPENAEVTIVSWGSTKGAILDALDELNADGDKVNFLQVRLLSPFPEKEITEVLGRAQRTVSIEENYSGQLAGIIRERTGIKIDHITVKYNGRPTTMDEVIATIEQVQAKAPERIVLRQGV